MAPQRNQRGVTSSRTRSTRSSSRPVTQGQNPQRSNRQNVSQARVTTSQQRSNRQRSSTARVTTGSNGRPTNTRGGGSARVTQGRSAGPTNADARRWQELNRQAKPNAPKPTPPRTPAPGTGNVERTAIQRGQAERERRRLATRQERLSRNNLGRLVRPALSALGSVGARASLAYETLKARPTAAGTISANDPKLSRRIAAMQKSGKEWEAQERRARQRNANRRGTSFNDAFRDARRAGVKTFTWQGKRYTTEMK